MALKFGETGIQTRLRLGGNCGYPRLEKGRFMADFGGVDGLKTPPPPCFSIPQVGNSNGSGGFRDLRAISLEFYTGRTQANGLEFYAWRV
jgi:hypothetical protein